MLSSAILRLADGETLSLHPTLVKRFESTLVQRTSPRLRLASIGPILYRGCRDSSSRLASRGRLALPSGQLTNRCLRVVSLPHIESHVGTHGLTTPVRELCVNEVLFNQHACRFVLPLCMLCSFLGCDDDSKGSASLS